MTDGTGVADRGVPLTTCRILGRGTVDVVLVLSLGLLIARTNGLGGDNSHWVCGSGVPVALSRSRSFSDTWPGLSRFGSAGMKLEELAAAGGFNR